MDYVDFNIFLFIILNLTTTLFKNCNLWDINAISSKLCIKYLFEIIICMPLMEKI